MPRLLTKADLPHMLSLQEQVMQYLAQHRQEHFIVPRDAAYFEKHMIAPHAAYSIDDEDGRLLAQALYHNPEIFNVASMGMEHIPGIEKGAKVSILQGALVSPAAQRQGLMRKMVRHWLNWCENEGIRHALARVEVTHEASRGALEQQGMHIVGTVIDARDDVSVHVLIKHLGKPL